MSDNTTPTAASNFETFSPDEMRIPSVLDAGDIAVPPTPTVTIHNTGAADKPLTETRKKLLKSQQPPEDKAAPTSEITEVLRRLPMMAKIGYFIEKTSTIRNNPGRRDLPLYVDKLLPEEMAETVVAFETWLRQAAVDPIEFADTLHPNTLAVTEDLLDGFADVAFLALAGMYHVFRISGANPELATELTEKAMHNVCNANNRKYPFTKNSMGKVMKPDGWVGPKEDTCRLVATAFFSQKRSGGSHE